MYTPPSSADTVQNWKKTRARMKSWDLLGLLLCMECRPPARAATVQPRKMKTKGSSLSLRFSF
jgi:hypothetical protein